MGQTEFATWIIAAWWAKCLLSMMQVGTGIVIMELSGWQLHNPFILNRWLIITYFFWLILVVKGFIRMIRLFWLKYQGLGSFLGLMTKHLISRIIDFGDTNRCSDIVWYVHPCCRSAIAILTRLLRHPSLGPSRREICWVECPDILQSILI